ncbi:LptA/OstA family protein [Ferrovibrio sp.]|uniref:LptA/OstA family protein n=1 Tax=Ferrovibrio sp. TaxID=1917215 RepID=UPI0026175856|nr:LptA/OstA family protein [Ferrovibrio sp.]
MRQSALFLVMLAGSALLALSPAFGQIGLNGRKNSDQPIEIASDTLEVQQDKQLAIFRGNVDAVQGDTRLRSAELFVYYRERSQPGQAGAAKPAPPRPATPATSAGPDASSITKIEAKGAVFVSTPQERGQGDFGVYDVDKKTITLTGNVVLSNDQGTVRCARAVMYQDTGRSTCDPVTGGRVRGVFVPKGDDKPAEGASPKTGEKR